MATLTWVAVGTAAWLTCAVLVGGLCMAAAYGDAVDSQTVPVVPVTAELALPDGLPQSAAEALEDLTVGVAQALGIDSVCVFMRDPGDPRHCLIAAGVRLSPGLIGRRYGSDQGVVGKALTTGARYSPQMTSGFWAAWLRRVHDRRVSRPRVLEPSPRFLCCSTAPRWGRYAW